MGREREEEGGRKGTRRGMEGEGKEKKMEKGEKCIGAGRGGAGAEERKDME